MSDGGRAGSDRPSTGQNFNTVLPAHSGLWPPFTTEDRFCPELTEPARRPATGRVMYGVRSGESELQDRRWTRVSERVRHDSVSTVAFKFHLRLEKRHPGQVRITRDITVYVL